ncbi:MAG: HAD family phosphatase [Candidatus Pacearchaeota archaeon]|jgi:epoxide hydrolase-like predicted phosphatase
MKQKIKGFIFDVGGVLQLPNPRFNHPHVHSFIAKELGISLDQYFDSIDTAYASSIEGKISEKKAIKTMSRNLKITPRKLTKLYMTAYRKNYLINKKLLQFASSLKNKGYRTAVLSDQWLLSKKALILPIFYKNFSTVVVSCDVGMRKPNPKIYNLTLKRLKLKPEEVIFIDNQKWNIAPAKRLGMKAILFKNTEQAIRDLKKWQK